MFQKCRITVVKRMLNREAANEFLAEPAKLSKCDIVADGQEFIISSPYEMPEGICASAWADIRPYIIAAASGGSFPMMKNPDAIVAACSDLFRPVIFKIEKIVFS